MELFHQDIFRFIKHTLIDTTFFYPPLFKAVQEFIIHIFEGKSRQRQVIPCSAAFSHQEGFKCGAGQYLPCAPTTVIVDSFTGNANGIWGYVNFNVFLIFIIQKIHSNNDTQCVTNLVWNIFQKFM